MQTAVLLYVHYKDSILLINWKKYGYWCCIGGNLNEQGNTIYGTGINSVKELCGITPNIRNLRGVFTFDCKVCPKCSTKYFVFEAESETRELKLNTILNNAKWVPIQKSLNYKLFPNSERFLLNTYLEAIDGYFELELEYTETGPNIRKRVIF